MDVVIPTCIHYNMENGSNKQPPMNIACSNSAVVSTSDGNYILVIGGKLIILNGLLQLNYFLLAVKRAMN